MKGASILLEEANVRKQPEEVNKCPSVLSKIDPFLVNFGSVSRHFGQLLLGWSVWAKMSLNGTECFNHSENSCKASRVKIFFCSVVKTSFRNCQCSYMTLREWMNFYAWIHMSNCLSRNTTERVNEFLHLNSHVKLLVTFSVGVLCCSKDVYDIWRAIMLTDIKSNREGICRPNWTDRQRIKKYLQKRNRRLVINITLDPRPSTWDPRPSTLDKKIDSRSSHQFESYRQKLPMTVAKTELNKSFRKINESTTFSRCVFPLNTRDTFDFSCYNLMKSYGFLHGCTSRRAKFCSLLSQFLRYFSSFL